MTSTNNEEDTPENRQAYLAQVKAAFQGTKARDEALQYLDSIKSTELRVADRYDEDEQLRAAIALFIPDYEYPDVSYLTLAQLHRRCRKTVNPDMVSLKERSVRRASKAAADILLRKEQ